MIKTDDLLTIRKGAVLFTYRVKALVENRLGAKLVPDFAENLTPQAELDKMKAPAETFFVRRDRGAGRPTKRDRRIMDEMLDNLSYFEDDSPDGDY